MLKVFRPDFNNAYSLSPCRSPNCPLKRHFLDFYLITFFGVRNFGSTSAMRVFFFWKTFQILYRFQKCDNTNSDKVSCFWDNSIWIGFVKLSLLRREYLSRAVNALTNTFKTLHIIKRDFFQPNCLHSDQ